MNDSPFAGEEEISGLPMSMEMSCVNV
jgi:hypothetical protein